MSLRPLGVALLIAGLTALPQTAPSASAAARPGVTRHVLDNGLTVIIKENPNSDLVVTEAIVRAGPRLEDPRVAGITFFVRAMLLRGTTRRSGAEIAEAVESVGGQYGGGTTADFTSLYTITASRHLDVGMALLAELLTDARFDPGEVEIQRRVSLSRIEQNGDQPLQQALDQFNAALYPYHPYARSVFGTAESVGGLTRDDLIAFYRAYFTAPNIVLVIAGNVMREAALDKARRAFAGLRAAPPPPRAGWLRAVERALAPAPQASQEIRQTRATSAAWIALGYLTVPAGHPDFPALRVLNAILGEGQSSRLFVEIREKRGLAYQVGSALPLRAGPGYIRLSAGTAPPMATAVVTEMLGQVERLREGAPPADEVEKARRGIIGRYALAHEELESQAFYLGWYEMLGVGYEYDAAFSDLIARVTPNDVVRVARRYMAHHVLVVVAPPAR